MVTTSFTGPSGKVFQLREQNGADDELLSKMATAKDRLGILNQFLAGIIQSIGDEKPVTVNMVRGLKLRDKYAILIQNRILSLGPTMKFEYKWDNTNAPSEYAEDLTKFVWDYTKPFPEVGDKDYYYQRLKPYSSTDGVIELTVGKKVFRADFLDGNSEIAIFEESEATINSELVARNLRIKSNDIFETVVNFAELSSRELAIIRSEIDKLDPVPTADVNIENPFTAVSEVSPLLAIRDFFFPTLL